MTASLLANAVACRRRQYTGRSVRRNPRLKIKVLPEQIAADPDFRRRFDREARVISSLNHPHICVLHDVGRQDEIDFLVMEYLEGETLAQRLAKGALPLAQALRYASEIADALDKAHRKGIVHRDLKPGNVMLTQSGAKLLDFGVAKLRAAEAGRPAVASVAATASTPLTDANTVIGTVQYMAPEQIEGKEADPRTDIFALATMLYEMISGRTAFEGTSRASLMSAILRDEPAPLSKMQPLTPPLLERLVQRCLSKEPDERWQSAADVMRELQWLIESRSHGTGAERIQSEPMRAAPTVRHRERMVWAAALAIIGLVAASFAVSGLRRPPRVAEVRLEITTPPTTDLVGLAISPDGTKVVFVATSDGMPRLWLRSLDATTSRPLPGTDFVEYPFWSPDSRAIGFFADGKVKRLDLDGGSAQTLAVASNPRGGAWASDGTIIFGAGGASPLFRVAATGGTAQRLTQLRDGQQSHRFPQVLPGGRHFLYYAIGSPEVRGVYVAPLDGSDAVRLLDADTAAAYAPPGRLLFVRQGTLFAQNFDASSRVLSGEPFHVAEQIARDPLSIQLAAMSPGSPISRTSPIAPRCTSSGFPAWVARYESHRVAARSRDGVVTGGSCSTYRWTAA